MRKSLFLPLLAMCLVLAVWIMLPSPVSAEGENPGGSCGGGLIWEFSEGTLTISGSGPMDDFPSGAPWSEYQDSIRSVILSGGVTTVGSHAFMDCDSLTQVDFGSALEEVGTRAFMYCDGLTSITLPESFRIFGEESFRSCSKLREIHCNGNMPSFRMSCLFDDQLTLYYTEGKIWPLEDIIWMESVFRMEFIREDGYDPYTPAATEPEPTTAPATIPTTAPVTLPTTPTTVPATKPVPTTEAAEASTTVGPTASPAESPTTAPQKEEPANKPDHSGNVGRIVALVCILILVIGALLLRFATRKRRGGKYTRRRRN